MINKYRNKDVAPEDFDNLRKARKNIINNIGEERLSNIRNTNAHLEFDIISYHDKVLEINKIEDLNKVFVDFDHYIDSLTNIAGKIGGHIDELKKGEQENMQKDLLSHTIFWDLFKDIKIRKKIMDKINKDYASNEAMHIEAKILMAYARIKAGIPPNEAYKKSLITREFYEKYSPESWC